MICLFIFQKSLSQYFLNLPTLPDDSNAEEIEVVLDSIQNKIISNYESNNFAEVIKYCKKGIELSNQIGDYHKEFKMTKYFAHSLLRVGDTLHSKKIYLSLLDISKSLNDNDLLFQANSSLGHFFNQKRELNKAIEYYKKSAAYLDDFNDGRYYFLQFNLAAVFLDLNDIQNTNLHLTEMQKQMEIGVPRPAQTAYFLTTGRLFLVKSQPTKALDNFKIALEIAEDEELSNDIIKAYESSIKALTQMKNYKEALEMRERLDKYSDENLELEKDKAIKEVIAKMNLEQYKQELKAKDLENELILQRAKRNELFAYILIFASLILCVPLVFLYTSQHKRKKLVKSLKDKNKLYITAKTEAERLAKLKNSFLSGITHELRTPLYGIIGIASILKEDKQLHSHKKDIDSLNFSADYLLSMINDLLYLNRLEEFQNKKLERKPFELHKLVYKIVDSFEFMKEKNSNELNIIIEPNVPKYIYGDDTKLSQILINIISNSCKFTEEGRITVAIQASKNLEERMNIHFCIADNGMGISEDKQAIIFNEFTQDSKSVKFEGSGLGLAIVKRLLELHDSKITLKSKKHEGTEFRFTIAYEIARESEFDKEDKIETIDKSVDGSHILIVDDNKLNRLVTRKALERNNYTCSEAQNGEVAVQMVKQEVFDLILMDLNMPIMDGFEATKIIREFETELPIIALTAIDPSQLNMKLEEIGFTNLIIKPYDINEFLSIIKNSFLSTTQI